MTLRATLPVQLLALVASAAILPTGSALAQSHADSVAVMGAVGAALRDEARQVLATIVCYARLDPCPPTRQGSTDVFMAELAEAAAAAIVEATSTTVPACPWGYDPPVTDATRQLR